MADFQIPSTAYRHVRGHFGEAQGSSGQEKDGVSPIIDKTLNDHLADELARYGITVDVVIKKLKTGTEVSLFGSKKSYDLAEAYLAKKYPEWKVRHHIPLRPQK